MLERTCPACRNETLRLPLASLHSRTVELACENCHRKAVSRIPNGAWWLHRLAFGLLSTLMVPLLFLFFLGEWVVWGFRFKSAEYADIQDRQMRLLIQCLRRGEMPTNEDLKEYS